MKRMRWEWSAIHGCMVKQICQVALDSVGWCFLTNFSGPLCGHHAWQSDCRAMVYLWIDWWSHSVTICLPFRVFELPFRSVWVEFSVLPELHQFLLGTLLSIRSPVRLMHASKFSIEYGCMHLPCDGLDQDWLIVVQWDVLLSNTCRVGGFSPVSVCGELPQTECQEIAIVAIQRWTGWDFWVKKLGPWSGSHWQAEN